MVHLLLVIIYIAFISLGLPDALLGAAWPAMYVPLGVDFAWAGIVSMVISAGTIFSSLFSGKFVRRMGTGAVTAVSVAMTAVALLGFSRSSSFLQLCLWAIPYGLGAGSVDAALNSFVALHYKSRHMSWLHCFWGVGATAGPYVMGRCLTGGLGWGSGYRIIGLLQVLLAVGLFFSLPLWRGKRQSTDGEVSTLGLRGTLALPGAKAILGAFLCYCALESTAGLWASSFLVLSAAAGAAADGAWNLPASLSSMSCRNSSFVLAAMSASLKSGSMMSVASLLRTCRCRLSPACWWACSPG